MPELAASRAHASSSRPAVERTAWRLVEAYQAFVYFALERWEECPRSGLGSGSMGYFARRSAALGRAKARGMAPVTELGVAG